MPDVPNILNSWAPDVAFVSDEADIDKAAEKLWEKHQRQWAQYESLRQLYQHHLPGIWAKLNQCRRHVKVERRDTNQAQTWIVKRTGCATRPYCPACNNAWRSFRAHRALKLFQRATPPGHEPAIQPWTITTHGTAAQPWRTVLAANHRRFMHAVARALDDIYGSGTGTLCVYQHYGENLFVHDHPHIHAIVNLHALRADKPHRLQRPDFAGVEREIHNAPFRRHIEKTLKVTIEPAHSLDPRAQHDAIGPSAIESATRYTFRELIDPLKFEYDAENGDVTISNYKDKHDQTTIHATTLAPRIMAYGIRFGDYTDMGREGPHRGARPTDAWYGTLSETNRNETIRKMGARPAHDENCKCNTCAIVHPAQYRPDLTTTGIDDNWRPF